MTKSKKIKVGLWLILASISIGLFVAIYLFFQPHRDVVAANADYELAASELVSEYLKDANLANQKYLDTEGESKIIAVSGIVSGIEDDMEGNKVVLLKDETDKAGVSCTFTPQTNGKTNLLSKGQTVSLKGVIRSGASFDSDLGLFENVILDKCDLVK